MDPQALPLRDIHLPDAPGYWPLAPGWWVLLILLTIVLVGLIKLYLKHKAKQKIINMLQSEVTQISDNYRNHDDKHLLAADVSLLLRRFTRYVLKDHLAATLTGPAWIDYLNSKSTDNVFSAHDKELIEAQFRKGVDFDVPKYIATIRNYFTDVVKQEKNIAKKQLKTPLEKTNA
jgi:hypothetical protein